MSVVSRSETSTCAPTTHSNSPPLGPYKIEGIRISEPACILFARHISSQDSVVLKMLFEYQDTRYNLATVEERQKCQLEALEWNRIFTPKIHIGLAHIRTWNKSQEFIEIDEIIENPGLEALALNTEYALLMRQLPTSRRLDYILTEEVNVPLQRYIKPLVRHVAHIHTNLEALSIPMEDAEMWGSFEQLRNKLSHNLEFLNQIMAFNNDDQYSSYYWLKDSLLQVFEQFRYQHYFDQRINEGRIKRCHADLKAPNIWIAPLPLPGTPNEYWYDKEPWRFIYLLDAIDFNPMYSYIDIVSDFAMLVTDINTRTKSWELADCMIEDYLELTNQKDEVSRLVLAYYLVEKAIIGAAVSILYDNLPDVGLKFLKTAEMRLIDLEHQMMGKYHLPAVLFPPQSSRSFSKVENPGKGENRNVVFGERRR